MSIARLVPRAVKDAALRRLQAAGYEIVRAPDPENPVLAPDLAADAGFLRAWERCRAFTMTSPERMFTLYHAVRHLVEHRIPGDLVECGVWKGGSAMLCALALAELGDTSRSLYLYDTYGGMAEPDARDVSHDGEAATRIWAESRRDGHVEWCFSPLDEVRRNLASTGYPAERLFFVQGRVEETIPGTAPERIALLRLDTDWYESTRHELEHLYPRVSPHGLVIVDDYGYWQGARQATDEFLARQGDPVFLGRIDFTSRLLVKPGA
jgi:hypothetical protein